MQESCSSNCDACGTGCNEVSSHRRTVARSRWSSPRSVFVRALKVPCSRSDRLLLTSAVSPSDWMCFASGARSLMGLMYALHLSVVMLLGGPSDAASALRSIALAACPSRRYDRCCIGCPGPSGPTGKPSCRQPARPFRQPPSYRRRCWPPFISSTAASSPSPIDKPCSGTVRGILSQPLRNGLVRFARVEVRYGTAHQLASIWRPLAFPLALKDLSQARHK